MEPVAAGHPDLRSTHAGARGIAAIHAIRALDADARSVVLGACGDEPMGRAFRAGARGYLLKMSSPDDLRTCLDTVLAGGRFLVSELAERLAAGPDSPDRPAAGALAARAQPCSD